MKTPGYLEDPHPREIARLRTLGLSVREAEVLYWLAHGKTNDEIAGILGIGFETVKTHVTHILTRLDVTNRIAAAVRARDTLRA